MIPASDTASNAFFSKVRLCCIVASFIGLASLGDVLGWAAEPGLEPPNRVNIKQAYADFDRPQDSSVDSDEELDSDGAFVSADDPSIQAQVPPAFMPRNMRSIISCGLLLLVMLQNIKATMESSFPSMEKDCEKKCNRRSFTSVVKRMFLTSQHLLRNPFFWFGMLVLAVIGAYEILYGILKARGCQMSTTAWYPFISVSAEGFGILSLRTSIRRSGHAQGISAKSVALFALLYLDTAFSFPDMSALQLDIWACKVLEWVSLALVTDVLYSILVTHRQTYQEELDVVPVKAMVCASFLFAFMYQPPRVNNEMSTIGFTFRLYVDTFAFVPQVVMMSLQDRPVHAPIAHFVAANTMGRICDLAFWLDEFKFWPAPFKMHFSGWLICLLHVASLVVVADFVYYYLKSWIAGRGFMEDVPIPAGIDV